MLTEILVAFSVVGILTLYFYKQRNNTKLKQKRSPPGPWGLPIMGHLPLLGKNPALKFLEWKKIYGPIFSVKFGSIPVVVLNDVKIIKDAFNQESFSGRPPLNNWVEMTGSKGIAFNNAGPRQSEQRKFSIKSFKEFEGVGKSAMEYRVEGEMSIFLNNLRDKCNSNKVSTSNSNSNSEKTTIKIKNVFQLPIINSFWDAIMGQRFDEKDPTVTKFMTIFEKLGDTSSSLASNLSWFFPWVSKLLVLLGLNPVVSGMREVYSRMEELIEDQKLDHVPGHPKHYTHAYFDQIAITKDTNSSFHHMSRSEQGISTGDLFLGAIDTTTVTLDWLLLYMAREQQVQRKLLDEIDAVMGSAAAAEHSNIETPSLVHRIRMPFTEAIIHEVTRIATLTPFGLFHLTLEDIQDFHGYFIPKDTMVIANLYGVHNDPEIWSGPDKFLPERFLNTHLARSASLTANLIPFSFGKRSYVGEGFARDQLFLIITSFFQKFTISANPDKIPSTEGHFGIVFAPPPFQIMIKER